MEDTLACARTHHLAHPPRREAHYLLRDTFLGPLESAAYAALPLCIPDDLSLPKECFILSTETALFLKQVYALSQRTDPVLDLAVLKARDALYLEPPLLKRKRLDDRVLTLPQSLNHAVAALHRQKVPALPDALRLVQDSLSSSMQFVQDVWPLTKDELHTVEQIMMPAVVDDLAHRAVRIEQGSIKVELPALPRRLPRASYRQWTAQLTLPPCSEQLDKLEHEELCALTAESIDTVEFDAADTLLQLEAVSTVRERLHLPSFLFELPEVPRIYSKDSSTIPAPITDVTMLDLEEPSSSADALHAGHLDSDPYCLFPPDPLNDAVEALRLPDPARPPSPIKPDRSLLPRSFLDVHRARHAKHVGWTVSALPAKHLDLQVSWMPFTGALPIWEPKESTIMVEEVAMDYLVGGQDLVCVHPVERAVVEVSKMAASSSTPVRPRTSVPILQSITVPTSPVKQRVTVQQKEAPVELLFCATSPPTPSQQPKQVAVEIIDLDKIDCIPSIVPVRRERTVSIASEDSLDRLIKRRKADVSMETLVQRNPRDPMLSLMAAQTQANADPGIEQELEKDHAAFESEPELVIPFASHEAPRQSAETEDSWTWMISPRALSRPGLLRALKQRLINIRLAERDLPEDEADILTSYASGIVLLSQADLHSQARQARLRGRLTWLLGRYRSLALLLCMQPGTAVPTVQMAQVALFLKRAAIDGQATVCLSCIDADDAARWIERLGYRALQTFDLVSAVSPLASPEEAFLSRWPQVNPMLAALILKATTVRDFILLTREERRALFGERYSDAWVDRLHRFCQAAWHASAQ